MEEFDKKYRKNGFKIPESYFDHFEDRVLERLDAIHTKQAPALSVWRKKTTWIAAAGLALVCSIAYLASYTSGNPGIEAVTFDQLNAAELAQYENEVELSEDEFEEIIPAYTVDSLYKTEILQANNNGFSKDELKDLEEEYTALDEEIGI
jgi:hypothetical protein